MVFYTGGNKTPSMARTEHGKEGTEKKEGDFDPDSIKDLNKPDGPGKGSTVTLSDGSVMTLTPDQKRTPEGEPASVWMPDYTRRNQGTRRYNADRGGGYLQGDINPNGVAGGSAGDMLSAAGDAQLFNNLSKAEALSEWENPDGYLTIAVKASIEALAKAMDYRKTGSGLWTKAINASYAESKKGIRKSPFKVLQEMAEEFYANGGTLDGSGGDKKTA